MLSLKDYRRNLVIPLALGAIVGVSPFLPGQIPEQSLVDTGSVNVPAVQAQSHPPTAEQAGDSLAARQRYQAAIEAYSKATEMTATIWNKMGISYQMMFNSKD